MSFRGRLRLFFGLIVIVPMIALAVVLFTLTARSETGKADAGISSGARTAFGVHLEQVRAAAPALREVTGDRELRAALARADLDAATEQLRALVDGDVVAIELYSLENELLERVGSSTAVAARGATVAADGQTVGTIAVAVTDAEELARRVRRSRASTSRCSVNGASWPARSSRPGCQSASAASRASSRSTGRASAAGWSSSRSRSGRRSRSLSSGRAPRCRSGSRTTAC